MASSVNTILVINAGSSSIKFALYDQSNLGVLLQGVLESIGTSAKFSTKGQWAEKIPAHSQPNPKDNHRTLVAWLLELFTQNLSDSTIVAAGHRVVHGGANFTKPALLTPQVIHELEQLTPLAPGHQPHNLAAIDAVSQIWPDIPQVASFDTAFHRTQSKTAQMFALPYELTDEGIVRYGFHGMSYQYICDQLPMVIGSQKALGKTVIAHLGHGASMCAVENLKSVTTTMGFTALDGLVMGKRCGDIDPGVLLYLCQQKGMSPAEVDTLLNTKSGLLGVSGLSSDMRDLLASDDGKAKQAVDLFVYRINQQLGSMVASLGGLETLVFTAGIGTHSASIRKMVCELAKWLGIELDEGANAAGKTIISTSESKIQVLVIPTDEEFVIASATRQQIT